MKLFYNLLISSLLILLTVFVFRYYVNFGTNNSLENQISFEILHNDKSEVIRPWKNDEGRYFVFLPSYAQLENVHIAIENEGSGKNIYLDSEQIKDGDSLENIELEKVYNLLENDNKYQIQFLQSANVASMYVNTQTGSMERIYADKNNKEKASVALYTNDGELDYAGNGNSIKGHGNGTFIYFQKKPLLLNLNEPGDLLGMGSARKWILLANIIDPTNLKNKIVFDFAKRTSLKWTPDCEYVDLYLNGEYNGLYLLCEKVEVGESRLDIGSENGFLCKNDDIGRMSNPFLTDSGRATEIEFPTKTSMLQKNNIQETVQMMENEILDKPDNTLSHLDLDSWVDKYLIDEISENGDADGNSSYFYCLYNGEEPTFFAGPIWDYDQTFGSYLRNENPKTFVNNCEFRTRTDKIPYYSSLYGKDIFYSRVKEKYEKEALPILIELTEGGIAKQQKAIDKASNMNKIRWFAKDADISSEQICSYLKDRIGFLNKVWINNEQICIVQFEKYENQYLGSYAVKYGETLEELVKSYEIDIENNAWIDMETGEPLDIYSPVLDDRVYIKAPKEQAEIPTTIMISKAFIMFLVVLAFFAFINIKNQKKEGRR